MRIASVRIKNFRSFIDETVKFTPYTCLVGPNGAGKSTVLCALNIFFRETENAATNTVELDKEDFHQCNVDEPVEITVTFNELSAEAQEDFKDYYRNGELVVTAKAVFDEVSQRAQVIQYGERRVMTAFALFFDAMKNGAKVQDLKNIYSVLKKDYDLDAATTKDAMIASLRAYETAHPELCELLPSSDEFYGFTKGGGKLSKYIQWIYVPAVKDATKEQVESKNTVLGKLLARTVRSKVNFEDDVREIRASTQQKYQELLERHQGVLSDLSGALGRRLAEWAHPEATVRLLWHQDPKKSVQVEEPSARLLAGEGLFEGDLARFGHGLQRSYLLALLQELSSVDDEGAPCLLLGCEEPELYQHPPQARHLASVLQSLSERNAQIIVSTHSPLFISGRGFESVRMVRRNAALRCSHVRHLTHADVSSRIAAAAGDRPQQLAATMAKVHQVLLPGLNEMFFTQRLILVEGVEDVAYITSWMVLTERWDSYRRFGCHIVPVNGKSGFLHPLALAQGMGIPVFVLFDADGDKVKNQDKLTMHQKDNRAILNMLGATGVNEFPNENFWSPNFVVWQKDFGAAVRADVGEENWQKAYSYANSVCGNVKDPEKNIMHVGARLDYFWDKGIRPSCLDRICGKILAFGQDGALPRQTGSDRVLVIDA